MKKISKIAVIIIAFAINKSVFAVPKFAIKQVKNETSKNLVMKIGNDLVLHIPAHTLTRKTVFLPMTTHTSSEASGIPNMINLVTEMNDSFPAEILTSDGKYVGEVGITHRATLVPNDPEQYVTVGIVFQKKNRSSSDDPRWYHSFQSSGDNNDSYGIQLHFIEDAKGNIIVPHDLDVAAEG